MRRRKLQLPPGDLQLAVMQVLWGHETATLREILAKLAPKRKLAATTVATVLSRLEQARVITHTESDHVRVYRPLIGRPEMQRSQAQRLIDRLFGGRSVDLIAHLVRESDIDEEELAEVRKLMRKRERK